MRLRHFGRACAALVGIVLLGLGAAQADVFYVDASIANTGRATNDADDWYSGDDGSTGGTPASGVTTADGLWRFRTNQGSGGGIWEATSSSTQPEDAAQIKTTVTNAPDGTYDVYVFYLSDPNPANWQIKAGLTADPTTLYDRSGTDGIAGMPVFTGGLSNLTFASGTQPTEDTQQIMLYSIIGQATVANNTLSVYIDDLPTSSLGSDFLARRTWYDGIGYFVPSTLMIFDSVMSGLATSGSTWTSGMPAAPGNGYRILDTHTVTVDSPFLGDQLEVTSGGTANFTASGVDIRKLIVSEGGNVTESVSGDFALGDISAATLGNFEVNEDLAFDIDAGSNFFLDLRVSGTGNIDFNAAAGSSLWLTAAAAHEGVIRFNGSGDQVKITESQTFGTLEMNSTGANTVFYDPQAEIGGGVVIFNQPGILDHASTTTSPQRRLHGVGTIVANAAVTVDLTKGFPDNSSQSEERRWLVGNDGIEGSADITVNGTAVDYSNGAAITHNEFEVGSTPDPTTMTVAGYSGTISANDFVDFEIRRHFPNARFVINSNARLEMGNQAIASNHSVQMGEVVINSGGTLEVGFEQQSAAGVAGHHAYKLTLTSEGTRDGSLTLADGSTTRMQVNGTATNQFDSIVADGNVQLNGTLNILVNPLASSGTNPIWAPTLGDTFDIISINSISPPGDYDGNGTVETADYNAWAAGFGTTSAALDGNGDGTVNAADYAIWRDNLGATGGTVGTITGTFDNVTVTDFNGAMTGFAFQVNYTSTLVQLEVVAAGSGSGGAVPEPSTLALGGVLIALWAVRRRNG